MSVYNTIKLYEELFNNGDSDFLEHIRCIDNLYNFLPKTNYNTKKLIQAIAIFDFINCKIYTKRNIE